jgi:myo-inositol 2-dehydrogenase/D-chiro-inositol 1-dehydrogenase
LSISLNLGLIGAGRIGQVHATSLASRAGRAELAVVTDVVPGAARSLAERFGVPRVAADYQAILADPSINAVLICTPTDTHAALIAAAAQAGKHIFCEKPVALDLHQTDGALSAVARAGVKLQIGFNRRFDPSFARVRAAVASGEIGTPHILRIVSYDPAPPPIEYVKTSGGMLLDLSIHDFDMAGFLIDSEIDEVYTRGGVMIDEAIGRAGDIDTAVTFVHLANGTLGTIDNSRQAVYGYDQRVEILGSRGAICTDNAYPNTAVLSTADSVHRDLPLNFFPQRYRQAFAAELEAFVEAVIDDRPVPVSGADARKALAAALAANRSLVEQRPVKVSEIA